MDRWHDFYERHVLNLNIVVGIYAAVLILPEMNRYRWFSQSAIGGTFNFWFFAGAVALLLMIKVVQLIEARGCSFSQRVDILKDRLVHSVSDKRSIEELSEKSRNQWWRYPVHALFGRRIWDHKLPCVTLT